MKPTDQHRDPASLSEAIIDRYRQGIASPEDMATLDAWRTQHPRESVRLDQLFAALADPGIDVPPQEATAGVESIRRAILEDTRRREHSTGRGIGRIGGFGNRTLRSGTWIGVLVGVLCVVALLHAHHGSGIRLIPTQTYATGAYQQGIVNLGNGSHVRLAPQTVLRVLEREGRARTVSLEHGEAYFDIAHGSSNPFVVESGTTTTRVLGTSFLIRHGLNDPHVRVAVMSGRVRVTSRARTELGITLAAGQIGDVTDSTTNVSTVDDVTPGTEWTLGHILFRDVPLATVLQMVTRWYGYQFRYGDQTLGARSVTMSISTQSSAEALEELEVVMGVNLTVVGDTVTLVPKAARPSHGTTRIRTYDVWTPSREVGR